MAKSKKAVVTQRQLFIAALAKCGNVSAACEVAALPLSTAYRWKQGDEGFAKAWDDAVNLGTDTSADAIEAALDRRATLGWDEPIFQGGRLVGHKPMYDTVAAIFRLKALRPDKYRERGTLDLNVIPNLPARLDAAERRLKVLKDRGE